MFVAVYHWRLKRGKEEEFRQAWSAVTLAIREKCGSLGSRLHRCEDGTWVAYAQWPSKEMWEADRPLGEAAEAARRQMRDAVEERLPSLYLTVSDDYLVSVQDRRPAVKPTLKNSIVAARSRFGQGVFAARPFSAGELILTFTGTALSLAQAERRGVGEHCLQVGIDLTLHVDEPARYVNHSCDPNAGLRDAVTLFALRPIAAGEEIVFDYSTCVLEEGWTLACSCQSPLCRGTVVDFARLAKGVKRKYVKLGAAPAWLFGRAKT